MPSGQAPAARLDTSLEHLLERAPAVPLARVLATVVATAGSTYRKSGARMMIMEDGRILGLLSGGCLEADLKLHARQVMADGIARAVEYDMRGPDDILFGVGAGCEGAMRVLLEPAQAGSLAAGALDSAGRATRDGHPAVLIAVHESSALPLGTYAAGSLPPVLAAAAEQTLREGASRDLRHVADGRCLRAFVQYLAPPPHVLVCGAGPDAEPLVSTARALGWKASVVDHRPAYADARRFAGATVACAPAEALRSVVALERCHAAIVMSHHLASDVAYLRELSAAGSPQFVGLLGPAARRERIAHELGAAAKRLGGRLRGPVGLHLGAVTPEGIALAIVSELHAWLAGQAVARTQQ